MAAGGKARKPSVNAMNTHWGALLRAVNVRGTGKLPMAELRKL
jgi:hypothetical protein